MRDLAVLIRWEDGALALTGWGWVVFWTVLFFCGKR